MAIEYRCKRNIIEEALYTLKKRGLVSKDAFFNYDAENDLREEVSYRDEDFLKHLGQTAEIETVDYTLGLLKEHNFIEQDAKYFKKSFSAFRNEIYNNFDVPYTAISPVMERLLYMCSSVKRPKNMLAIGIFCGNTLAWNVGPAIAKQAIYKPDNIIAIDIDAKAIELAEENFSKITDSNDIQLIAEDALLTLDKLDINFDYVYLDADNEEFGKGLYLKLLQKFYNKLNKGAWILAHDSTFYHFKDQLKEYLSFVRDKTNFSESISFDVDRYGLELTIK